MSLQNRVDPWGILIADPARGSLMGNRGLLHDEHRQIRRSHQLKRWIICVLEFKGRRREIMRPGHYTELFFLDEATALAAGHRPCAECQRPRYNEFRSAWMAGNPGSAGDGKRISAERLDEQLHRQRLADDGGKRTFRAAREDLPDGVFVAEPDGDAAALLLWGGRAWGWRPGGYEERPLSTADVDVLTPRPTVNALAGGYFPAVAL